MVSSHVAIGDVNGVRGFVILGVDPTPLGVASWEIPTDLAVLTGVGWSIGTGAFRGDGRSGRTLALRVNAKLDTLSGCSQWSYGSHPSRGPPSDRSGIICWNHNPCEGYGSCRTPF